ncbi:ribose 5-phosphate isomerase A [Niabella ginsenosidivorans]|uniref:Ribose-5-phosphate isomerase A n=1 Tax=Niabella ginsenosidivorans TaxID=1176587 RepID=A0A1A9HZ26_9BACT|nr:ribose-5-phosphate isomerase RpiA [Niabella ginsenosidivorans]ANH79730.1 ribose 5-phosphate isomerase A [Niabella ginsenosidivorans]
MNEQEKKNAALKAVTYIKEGQIIGLGTGSTAYFAIQSVGEMVKEGLTIKAIPTSEETKKMAAALAIPLADINEVTAIDITIDGADEFDSKLQLIKGGGGALLREKIVASITQQQIIIADSSKQVEKLGAFKVPVEVIPFASNAVARKLSALNGRAVLRNRNGQVYLTDQHNYILDVDFGLIDDPAALAKELDHITGVVEHGLFIDLASMVICGKGNVVTIYQR